MSTNEDLMALMFRCARMGKIVANTSSGELDFCKASDMQDMLVMASTIDEIDVSGVTKEDLDDLRNVRHTALRKDIVTEGGKPSTLHPCGYYTAVNVIPE